MMFNMDMMRQGAEAFGKIAETIERLADGAYAFAIHHEVACPHGGCNQHAAHPGAHGKIDDDHTP